MKVVVTGAAGQLGSAVVDDLFKRGNHDVVSLTKETMDLTNRDVVLAKICSVAPDVIINCAAMTKVDACEHLVSEAFAVNTMGTRFIVEAANITGAHVVLVSTDYVFSGDLERPYLEFDQTNPRSIYGLSKLGAEKAMRPSDTIVRTSWVFGKRGSNIIKTIMRVRLDRDVLHFVNDQIGHPSCAEDIAPVLNQLAIMRVPGILHLTNQTSASWYEFAQVVLNACGDDPERVKPISTSELAEHFVAPRPTNSVLENAALKTMGIALPRCYKEAVEDTVKFLLEEAN